MKKWLFILFFLPMMAMAGSDPLPLDELAGAMDRQVLETEIANVEAAGQAIKETERLKRLGIAWHNLSVLEVGGASKEADKWLKKAFDIAPTDYEVMAYHGSARTMVARDSWNVVTKVSQANKGIALIDRAIREAPDNVIVRMVRANNSLALPEMFERRPKAREDFGFLHGRLDKLDISPETRAEICFKLGQILEEDGDRDGARALYEETRTLSPGGSWAQQAIGRLRSK
uniref:Tetratricopeptide repeat n=1 Tax=Candidatus Kentrum sp. LFY TaxID=2126342 RepID=A0A450UKU3_9GAMM|nr:MAG: Tetratricopeptide repeat [Candidatus Kentron sp. LFY]